MDNILLRLLVSVIRIAEYITHALFGARSFSSSFGQPVEQSGSTMATITAPQITATQRVKLTLVPTNRLNKPAKIDGSIDFLAVGPELSVYPVDGEPNNFWLSGTGTTPETAPKAVFTADADLGEGIETISLDVIVPIGDAPAAGFGGTFAEPSEIPDDVTSV